MVAVECRGGEVALGMRKRCWLLTGAYDASRWLRWRWRCGDERGGLVYGVHGLMVVSSRVGYDRMPGACVRSRGVDRRHVAFAL